MRPGSPVPAVEGRGWQGKRRGSAIAVLTVVVVLVHLWLTYEVATRMEGAAQQDISIKRMEASYVTEVRLSTPPVAAAALPQPVHTQAAPQARPKPKRKKVPPKPAKAASQPLDPASAPPPPEPPGETASAGQIAGDVPEAAPAPAWRESEARLRAAEARARAAAAAASAASAPPAGPVFVWPKATRVSYKLEGYFRGPFHGSASVEWVREGQRYQVRMEASAQVLGSIHMVSEGRILPEGLSPERYESFNRMMFRTSPTKAIQFEDKDVVLPDGERVARPSEVQDPVSHLIQLAYRFITDPSLLRPGNTITMPLASTKRVEVVAFDVVAQEVLHTGMGDVPALHVKPRRLMQDKDSLLGDIWFAPGLQYLPIKIYAKWSEDSYLEMQMDGAPQQTPGDAPLTP